MIWKKSEMEIGESVLIEPIELQEEKVEGKYGPQDKWYIKVGGEPAMAYTGYINDRPDRYGRAFRGNTGGSIVIEKGFDQSKGRAYYIFHAQGEKATAAPQQTQPTKKPSKPSPKMLYQAQTDKGLKIGLYACLKVASHTGDNVEEIWHNAVDFFNRVNQFVEDYRPEMVQIEKLISGAKLGNDFRNWLAEKYEVDSFDDLSTKMIEQVISKFDRAVASYNKSKEEEELSRQVEEDRISEPEIEEPPF